MNVEYAFPSDDDLIGAAHHPSKGMTLRDYFAAHAPTMPNSYIERFQRIEKNKDPYNEKGRLEDIEILCKWRIKYANSMMEARKK